MDSENEIRIFHLADLPECIPLLAGWFVAEWEPYYGAAGPGDAKSDLADCCRRDGLPTALVAVDAGETVVGTIALRPSSVGSRPGEGPWLSAFLVAAPRRRQGIGSRLVAVIEDRARELGFDTLFTSTDARDFLSAQKGWQPLRQEASLRGPVTVYRRRLD
ncbi:GNAT family N-acetyltransferase [Nitratireductor sp. XY-223]|uniref:GNAT family N-acetyltransferase n=1 Tax=Nitratireductor sp. XY-223 TaxID=2561926 RepID=UPI0010AAA65F|nr:GNAT family N-acetyltransferase [Nitratireductor sp. XY-223]